MSIHHLEHPDKQTVFRKIYDALRPGGMFIDVDQALAPSPLAEEQYEAQWLADVEANGIAEHALQQARERMRGDRNAMLSDQLRWLAEAGFEGVHCWYQRSRFVVFGGSKGRDRFCARMRRILDIFDEFERKIRPSSALVQ